MYGVEGLQKYIREHVRLAKMFEGLVKGDARFEIMNKVEVLHKASIINDYSSMGEHSHFHLNQLFL